MHLFRRSYACIPDEARVVAALGNFDGVHRGHQVLLRRIIEVRDQWRKEGVNACALLMSFDPHPVSVIGKTKKLPFVSTIPQRLQWTAQYGVDFFNLIHFTESFAQISAEDFIREFLIQKAKVRHLVLGEDARVGFSGKGDVDFIKCELNKVGSVVEILPFEKEEGIRISSGVLRNLISEGRLEEAERMLGRPFQVEGRILVGDKRGRKLGFPTINLLPREQLCPPKGVYVSESILPDRGSYPSVSNVGTRPTFGSKDFRIETHVLDYDGPDLYGKRVEVSFLKRLREERKFSTVDELVVQMRKDKEAAKDFFKCR